MALSAICASIQMKYVALYEVCWLRAYESLRCTSLVFFATYRLGVMVIMASLVMGLARKSRRRKWLTS